MLLCQMLKDRRLELLGQREVHARLLGVKRTIYRPGVPIFQLPYLIRV